MWRRNDLRAGRDDHVRPRLGQAEALVRRRLFLRNGRTDDVGLGNGDRLVGLRSHRHDAIRFLPQSRGEQLRSCDNSGRRHSFRLSRDRSNRLGDERTIIDVPELEWKGRIIGKLDHTPHPLLP